MILTKKSGDSGAWEWEGTRDGLYKISPSDFQHDGSASFCEVRLYISAEKHKDLNLKNSATSYFSEHPMARQEKIIVLGAAPLEKKIKDLIIE